MNELSIMPGKCYAHARSSDVAEQEAELLILTKSVCIGGCQSADKHSNIDLAEVTYGE